MVEHTMTKEILKTRRLLSAKRKSLTALKKSFIQDFYLWYREMAKRQESIRKKKAIYIS